MSNTEKLAILEGVIRRAVEKNDPNETEKLLRDLNQMHDIDVDSEDSVVGLQNYIMPDEIISGLLHAGHSMLISAQSKAKKSFLLLALAVCLANGLKWLNTYKCKKSKCLYINFEIHRSLFLDRINNVQKALIIEPSSNLRILNIRGRLISVEELITIIKEQIQKYGIEVVIFDPFYKVCNSNVRRNLDENSSNDMGYILSCMSMLLTEGVTTITSHHFTKGNSLAMIRKEVIDRSSGSGVLARDPDLIATVVVKNSEVMEDLYTLEFVARNFVQPYPLDILWKYPLHIATDEYGFVKKEKDESINYGELCDMWIALRGQSGDDESIARVKKCANHTNLTTIKFLKMAKSSIRKADITNTNIFNFKITDFFIVGKLPDDYLSTHPKIEEIPLDI